MRDWKESSENWNSNRQIVANPVIRLTMLTTENPSDEYTYKP